MQTQNRKPTLAQTGPIFAEKDDVQVALAHAIAVAERRKDDETVTGLLALMTSRGRRIMAESIE